MHRTYEHGTKARLSFSGGPHAPVNIADSMEEVNVGGKNTRNGILKTFAALYLFSVRSSGIFHTICHVYRNVWPARDAKPCFGAVLIHSALIVKLAYWIPICVNGSKQGSDL